MASDGFRFDRFLLDPRNRRLRRDDVPVELNARYLDALALLVREADKLVSKDRFLEEVWRGVPVTDEALTQCIKTFRRQLGDNAADPRFIETVPKHGYRFIAPVEEVDGDSGFLSATPDSSEAVAAVHSWRRFFVLGLAGTIGSGVAGLFGGLFYGFVGASQRLQPGMGAVSVLLVLTCVTVTVALIGGAGVSFGIAAASFASNRPCLWSIVGGAAGGLVTGAIVKLLGLDAFDLLFGQSPGNITGPTEGALLGGAVGFGAWLGSRVADFPCLWHRIAAAGITGGIAGVLIALLGGRLMGGSLILLAHRFPNSRLRLDQIGGMFGEGDFGPISRIVTGGLEGALFAGCIVGAMVVARERHLTRSSAAAPPPGPPPPRACRA